MELFYFGFKTGFVQLSTKYRWNICNTDCPLERYLYV